MQPRSGCCIWDSKSELLLIFCVVLFVTQPMKVSITMPVSYPFPSQRAIQRVSESVDLHHFSSSPSKSTPGASSRRNSWTTAAHLWLVNKGKEWVSVWNILCKVALLIAQRILPECVLDSSQSVSSRRLQCHFWFPARKIVKSHFVPQKNTSRIQRILNNVLYSLLEPMFCSQKYTVSP